VTFVEVAFANPIANGVLTYHISEEREVPPIGARVVVPIQHRQLVGYVTKTHNEAPSFKTVELGEVLDPTPLITPQMFELAKRIAYSCVCNIGEVLNTMLPAGIKQHIVRQIRVIPENIKEENLHEGLKYLIGLNDWVNYATFCKNYNIKNTQINTWLGKGYIEIEHCLTEAQGPRIIKVLRLNPEKPIEVAKLTPKEKLVMEAIMTCNTAPQAALLAKKANVSSAPINQLKKKGYLVEVEERVIRHVATEDYYKSEAAVIPELNEEQKGVLEGIREAYNTDKKPVLVRGVTCSGKTEVYLRWVAEIISQNKSAIVLVPEISLTPQMMKRFIDRFGKRVAILHSKLSDGERFDQWENIRRGLCPVVVGARSAVFAPLPNLGTIILDEEGEPTFKQADSPRYHAREVAAMRCKLENALLIMGSATPTIDSYQNCLKNNYHLYEMNKRVSNRQPPKVQIVDMRKELVTKKQRSMFSESLTAAIAKTLAAKKQAILYLNRRGYSTFVLCAECGEAVKCSKCNISMAYHSGSDILRCHYCGEIQEVPKVCPKCQSKKIKFFGAGTQLIEAQAKAYFPNARIQRLDSDVVTAKGSMEEILDSFGKGNIDILIGTQMVAKGLDFPNVTLVGIIAADSLLRLPDFRASERNFSLLAQVAGRAGRGDTPGDVVLQTYCPEHHSIQYALTEDFHGFFDEEAKLRKEALFPPFIELAHFIISSPNREKAANTAQQLYDLFAKHKSVDVKNLFGPAPAALEQINNRYRYQVMLKMPDLEELIKTVKEVTDSLKKPSDTRLNIDINPYFMM
jgi:primosomal protein N' (replication factor Y)